jgi:hypothetical protein
MYVGRVVHTVAPFVPKPSASDAEVAIGKLRRYKSPGVDKIPAQLILAGGEELPSEFHKFRKLIWNKEELPSQWKVSVVPIHKKGDKIDCSNYRGTSFMSTSYKILSDILLSRLTTYADEIMGDHKCGLRSNRSTSDQISYIRHTGEKMGV